MATEYEVKDKELYIRLDGELDHHLAEQVRYQCEKILNSYTIKDIIFDFYHSEFMDSSGVGLILGRYQQMHSIGGHVFIMNANDVVKRVVHMAGLYRMIKEK